MANPVSAKTELLDWYKHLSSRHVDLVGDYAGNELFLVEGDSLLLTCLENEDVDLQDGFQLLHAVHSVESFLYNLVQRKCNFHVAFFDTHKHLCVPPHLRPENSFKYKLARAIIVRHLQVNLRKIRPEIKVAVYDSFQSPDFVQYMATSGLYFIMCHDGASSLVFSEPNPESGPPVDELKMMTNSASGNHEVSDAESNVLDRRIAFRFMMYWFIKRGYNIALINSTDWHDTKVMAMVLEGSRRTKKGLDDTLTSALLVEQVTPVPDTATLSTLSTLSLDDSADFESEAQLLLASALRLLLASEPSWSREAYALVLHSAVIRHLPFASRRLPPSHTTNRITAFLGGFCAKAHTLLCDPEWTQLSSRRDTQCDIADLIDGRLFSRIVKKLDEGLELTSLSGAVGPDVEKMLKSMGEKGNSLLSQTPDSRNGVVHSETNHQPKRPSSAVERLTLLPFSNDVFDRHLVSVHISTQKTEPKPTNDRTFRELSHWHNTKPIVGKAPRLTEWQKARAMRNNQFFMREMTQYAASLTNAVGKSLDPEPVITGSGPQVAVSSLSATSAKAENVARIAERNEKRYFAAWQTQAKDLDQIKDLEVRFIRSNSYLEGLSKERRQFIGLEVELYQLNILLTMWSDICRTGKQLEAADVAALLFDSLNKMYDSTSQFTKTIETNLQLTSQSLGLPFKKINSGQIAKTDRPLSFAFILSKAADRSLEISASPREFQLQHCGPYFDRSMGPIMADNRVRFNPDPWQRKVLDEIDAEKSVFVVAPTSAGKTFISFYAMSKTLYADDDGIIVYVAPTKALVNQIAAEIQARFSKKFKYGGKSVWAIHTRDYRINDPKGCQVLVTVPHILQIMLLAPSNAKSWSTRVRRIIFDEIHSIGQAEDGVVWEQLLLLSPCPIICLSATVGNPSEFNDWLTSTQRSMGFEMEMVTWPYRYSDLRKFVYQPPKRYRFESLSSTTSLGVSTLDNAPGMIHFHPVASLINESRGIPDDLHLEPRECLSLWQSFKRHETQAFPVNPSLDPDQALPEIVRKKDIIEWEVQLKNLLKQWMADGTSPFKSVIEDFQKPLHSHTGDGFASSMDQEIVDDHTAAEVVASDLCSTTLPLLSALNARNALPALLFNYDRSLCEKICQVLMSQLTESEAKWKEVSPIWAKKLAGWERWKIAKEKKPKKAVKKTKSKPSKKGDGDEDEEEEKDDKVTKGEMEREAAEGEANPFATFDPAAPVEGFHFANLKTLLPSEFAEVKRRLERRHVAEWLIEALKRGLGVHHAGMNRAYRQVVEVLFRKGFLRVVVATGTLALGINMPCKTVVFSGDSVFLTALNYRQAAGRAGRRGFDLLGNIVFQNIELDKVSRLVSSRLPDLNGHFPITTTLVLRLFTLLHDSKGSPYAKKAINSLLSQPRLYLGGSEFREQVLHHLRFSIEYLRRQFLLGSDGSPLNFAGAVSHLYFTENSAFAFHALLKDGYFLKVCADFNPKSEEKVLEKLMLVMAHLFGRRPCRRADQEFIQETVKRSPSMVFLPHMPAEAEQILREHNKETLRIFSTYVKTFADQHLRGEDRKLPLTEVLVGGNNSSEKIPIIESLPATKVRSAFAALSGLGDDFTTISELCRTSRDGVFLEESVVPHVALYPEESVAPMNAYLLDFYKHGSVSALETANGIRRGDVWFLLNDFSLVLATIVTSLKGFLNLSEDVDLELVEAAGSGDAHELDEDDRLAKDEDDASQTEIQQQPQAQTQAKTNAGLGNKAGKENKKKKIIAESWDDEDMEGSDSSVQSDWASDDDADSKYPASTEATSLNGAPVRGAAPGDGLMNILKAFERLKVTFDEKFRKMWA